MSTSCSSVPRKKPHAVLLPFPAQGHINPMMLLGKILASRGVRITLVSTQHTVSTILRSTANGSSFSDVGNLRLVGIPDGLPDDSDRAVMGPYLRNAVRNMGSVFEAVLQDLQVEEEPVTCVIGDCFLTPVRVVARKLNIPRVVFWPQSATVFALFIHSKDIIAGGLNLFDGTVKVFGRKQHLDLISCVPGVPPLHPAYFPLEIGCGIGGLLSVKKWVEEEVENLSDAVSIIGNSFQNLEPQVCKTLTNFQPIGPLVPRAFLLEGKPYDTKPGSSLWKEDDCTDWLDKHPESSVLYVSFGSIARFSIAQIREIAWGLMASGHRFLWVLRPDAVVESVANVLEALPERFLDQTERKGKIINWAPQAQVLAHPSVSGFFSHCGWNSTMESLCMGVPLLGWPQIFDQITNCWMVVNEWKIGVELERDEENKTDRRQVETAVRSLMEGQAAKERRARALNFRNEARKAVQADGCSTRTLESLIEDLFQM